MKHWLQLTMHILAHNIMHESQAVTFETIAGVLIWHSLSILKAPNESILHRILSLIMHKTYFHIKNHILLNILYQPHFLNIQQMYLLIIHPMLLHIMYHTVFLCYAPDTSHNYTANTTPYHAPHTPCC